jgi:hypothetical protein
MYGNFRFLLQFAVGEVKRAIRRAVVAFRLPDEKELTAGLLANARTSVGCNLTGVHKEAINALDGAYGTLLRVVDPDNVLQRAFYDKFKQPRVEGVTTAPTLSTTDGVWVAELHKHSGVKRMFPFSGTAYEEFVHLLQHAFAEVAANLATAFVNSQADAGTKIDMPVSGVRWRGGACCAHHVDGDTTV